jgi:hypothetical protein
LDVKAMDKELGELEALLRKETKAQNNQAKQKNQGLDSILTFLTGLSDEEFNAPEAKPLIIQMLNKSKSHNDAFRDRFKNKFARSYSEKIQDLKSSKDKQNLESSIKSIEGQLAEASKQLKLVEQENAKLNDESTKHKKLWEDANRIIEESKVEKPAVEEAVEETEAAKAETVPVKTEVEKLEEKAETVPVSKKLEAALNALEGLAPQNAIEMVDVLSQDSKVEAREKLAFKKKKSGTSWSKLLKESSQIQSAAKKLEAELKERGSKVFDQKFLKEADLNQLVVALSDLSNMQQLGGNNIIPIAARVEEEFDAKKAADALHLRVAELLDSGSATYQKVESTLNEGLKNQNFRAEIQSALDTFRKAPQDEKAD